MPCDKRAFPSKGTARQSVKHMHETVRQYWCKECGGYHNTKERTPESWGGKRRVRGGRMKQFLN